MNENNLNPELSGKRKWETLQGIMTIILGMCVILDPLKAIKAFVLFFGANAFSNGVLEIATYVTGIYLAIFGIMLVLSKISILKLSSSQSK